MQVDMYMAISPNGKRMSLMRSNAAFMFENVRNEWNSARTYCLPICHTCSIGFCSDAYGAKRIQVTIHASGSRNAFTGSVIQFSRRPGILTGGFAAHEREQDADH